MKQTFNSADFNIKADGVTNVTKELQALIDKVGDCQGILILPMGKYLTGSLFLRSNMELHLEEGAVILGSQEEKDYPIMETRAAGIEMEWMVALINAIDCENITISGKGMIDGQGEIWWEKFWGKDRKGGMCKEYDEKGLRWAADYDCMRPRLIQIRNCKNVVCREFSLLRSGFWNLHICYSNDVKVNGIKIVNAPGPSTDGIDIDSCKRVLIEQCDISCNDDNIVIKAGMNADGMRVNRICEDVEVRNCILREGMGLALGSDMAGGINNVYFHDIQFKGTDNGVYLKSSKIRGGYVENVRYENLNMVNVACAINLDINWFPDFSYPQIPDSYTGGIPKRWKLLTEKVPEGKGMSQIRDICIKNLTSSNEEDYKGKSKVFYIGAYDENPIQNLRIEKARIAAKEFGTIHQLKNLELDDVVIDVKK